MNKLHLRSSNYKNLRKFIVLSTIFCFLAAACYLPNIYIENIPDQPIDKTLPNIDQDINIDSSDSGESDRLFYHGKNMSQFDIYESTTYLSNKDVLDIDNEYLAFDIPESWAGRYTAGAVFDVFSKEQIFEGENWEFNNEGEEWFFDTSYPYPPLYPSDPYVNFEWDSYDGDNGYIRMELNNTNPYTPSDFYGEIANENSTFYHSGDTVEIGERFKGQESEIVLDDDFIEDPGYRVIYDPYGDKREKSDVAAYHNPSIDSMVTELDLWDGVFNRGDPSVALQSVFYIPFEPDQVTIRFGWSVENLGYERADGFQVKSRINGQYIDGSVSAYGEEYPEGAYDALEKDDDFLEIQSHDVWDRVYDVTPLLGNYGNRAGWHALDFGCWMSTPDFEALYTPDDAIVNWDFIEINVTHYDWYKAAEINFEYCMENLGQDGDTGNNDTALVMYFGDPGIYGWPDIGRYVVNRTSDLVFGDWENDRVNATVLIPHHYMHYFQKDGFIFRIGIECVNPYTGQIYSGASGDNQGAGGNIAKEWNYELCIDNIDINVNYVLGGPEDVGLEYRIVGSGDPWVEYSNEVGLSQEIYETAPGFEVEFQVTDLNGATNVKPFMRFIAGLYVDKMSDGAAEASVTVEYAYSDHCFWNITYNNTESVNEFDDPGLTNNTFNEYNITIINLPAFDGLGANSEDWDISSVIAPNDQNASQIADIWSTHPFYQNGTVVNGTYGSPGSLLRGTWKIYATQSNYMVGGSFNHPDGDPSERFYHGDDANYTLKVRDLGGASGNYSTYLYNASDDLVTPFPNYHEQEINHTEVLTVEDNGVGYYTLVSIFNNTDSNNQTTRLGWWRDSFQMWRQTEVNVLSNESPVPYGDSVEYLIEYNSTVFGGIDAAYIHAYNNNTGILWGRDWTGQYLLDYKTYVGDGRYKIALKTDGVPVENYTVHFHCNKPFHNIRFTDPEWLNMTITIPLKNISVSYLSGAFNFSETNGFLTGDNVPIVNDTSNFVIQFQLNETGGGPKIEQAYVTASFNQSDNLMVAIEEYALTHLDKDRGIYNLTLDCDGLNATTVPGNHNYTLSISFSADGFNPFYQNISVQIRPMPLVIQAQQIDDIYEGYSFTIQSSLYLDPMGGLIGCDYGLMNWGLYNSSDAIIRTGSMIRTTGNSYSAEVIVDDQNYLNPGDYYVIINATGENLLYTESSPIEFTVFEKYVSQVSLVFPEKVRINTFFTIAAKLTYVNATPIVDKDISLFINYSSTYSYEALVKSDGDGRGVYELSIPEKYKDENLTVFASFDGSDLIKSSWKNKTQKILGKIGVNITFSQKPETVQVGYSATYGMELIIEGEENYEGTIVYLFGFYDYCTGSSTQPFLVREISTDENGTASYTIDSVADGYDNLTVFFEYIGDGQTEHEINSTCSLIINKWNTTISYQVDGVLNGVPETIRQRQTIDINITLNPLESTFSETYAGVEIQMIFNYSKTGGAFTYNSYTYYTDANGSLLISYTVLDQDYDALNVTITFDSTTRINGTSAKISTPLLPKKNVLLSMQSYSEGELIQGTYYYSINLTDDEDSPLANVEVSFQVYDGSGNPVGDSYSGVTNAQGFVSVSIDMSELPPGEYEIKAEFGGEGIYAGGTSGGINVQITTPWLIFVGYLPYIALALGIIVATIFTVYKTVIIPRRIRRMEALKAIHQRFEDAENIQYVLILSRESGLNIFARSFTNLPIDADLISGFLTAISSFGAEIGGKMENRTEMEKGLEQLSYKQFKIIVNDVALVRTAILLLNDASPTLKQSLKRFNLRFQEKFIGDLENWNGRALPEGAIMEVIEEHLDVDLLYPHNLNPARTESIIKTLDKNSIERQIIEEAKKPKFSGTFRIRAMLNHMLVLGEEEVVIFNAIDTLRKERVLYAINPRTQYLIDKFRPIIDNLPDDAKTLLLEIAGGNTSESKLRKVKGVQSFDESIAILLEMQLIDQLYRLTETGDALVTIMRLMPNV